MILSISRRTDIPCCYADWLEHRLREGYALVRLPRRPDRLWRVPISADVVDGIVFWTKDPAPMLPLLPTLDRLHIPYYFQFTLTPYDQTIEPGLRDKTAIGGTFRALAEQLGPERVLWRYDPIILNDAFTENWHREQFARWCDRLQGATRRVTVSFLDLYARRPHPLLCSIKEESMRTLGTTLAGIARAYGLRIAACCESADLADCGIGQAHCVDRELLEQLAGTRLSLQPDRGQRPGCGCCESVDIGAYGTCPNGCLYCYAGRGEAALRKNRAAYRPEAPLLTGETPPETAIADKCFYSHKIGQLSFF